MAGTCIHHLDLSAIDAGSEVELAKLRDRVELLTREGKRLTMSGGTPELRRITRFLWAHCLLRQAESLDPGLFSPA